MDDIAVPLLHAVCLSAARAGTVRSLLVMRGQSALLITGCWAVFVSMYMCNSADIGPRNSQKKEDCAIDDLKARTQAPWSGCGSNLYF